MHFRALALHAVSSYLSSCGFFHHTLAIWYISRDGVLICTPPAFWAADPPAKVPPLAGLNVLFIHVELSKQLNRYGKQMFLSPKGNYVSCLRKTAYISVRCDAVILKTFQQPSSENLFHFL